MASLNARTVTLIVVVTTQVAINLVGFGNGFEGYVGVPFIYAHARGDAPPVLMIEWWSLGGNVAVLVLVLFATNRLWARTTVSSRESIALVSFSSIYLWANRQQWFGWQHSFWTGYFQPIESKAFLYGCPFTYIRFRMGGTVPEIGPIILYADFLLGLLIVLGIHKAYNLRQ